MVKLTLSPASDDRVGINFAAMNECYDTGELKLTLRLPGGLDIPCVVSYGRDGFGDWDFELILPPGSEIVDIDHGWDEPNELIGAIRKIRSE